MLNTGEHFQRFIIAAQKAGSLATGAEVELTEAYQHTETRDYQIETWLTLEGARQRGDTAALVHLATGLGKTTIAVIDALRFTNEFMEKEGRPPRILFAVHQNSILEQAMQRFDDFAPDLSHGRYSEGSKDIGKDITFATMQSLHKNLDDIPRDQFDYIIYDEAHHTQAETFKEVVEYFRPSFRLALTATPDRMDEERIEELFGEPVYSKPLAEAMADGYLANVDYHIVFDEAVKKAMDEGFSLETLKEIRQLLTNESRNEEIALQIMEEMEKIGLKDAKTIVFCNDVEQATQMADLLDGKPYHSRIDRNIRRQTLDAFRSNGIQVITARDMFNEGVDIPDARLLVFLRSTASRTIFEQQLGRGLRKTQGKDTVSVLDFVANIERLSQVKDFIDEAAEYKARQYNSIDGANPIVVNDSESGLHIHTDHTDFDFDRVSIALLDRINTLRSALKTKSIWELAAQWQEQFGNVLPTSKLIRHASKNGLFISHHNLKRNYGGINALKKALGDELAISTIEEAAHLWHKKMGADVIPTMENIEQAAKAGEFVSYNFVLNRGGIKKLRQLLSGARHTGNLQDVDIEELSEIWKKQFGDQKPTYPLVKEAAKKGLFVSIKQLESKGGVRKLQRVWMGHSDVASIEYSSISTMDDLAALWVKNFGNEIPTMAKVIERSKQRRFVSRTMMQQYGGVTALKAAIQRLNDE